MANAIYKLKDVFTIENVIAFFKEHISWFLKHFTMDHFWHICSNIKRFMECRDFKKNFATFVCPKCGKTAVRPNTCKSRLCPTCGKPYSDNIAENFANKMIHKKHRSILFSMPDYLWNFFIGKTHLLAIISNRLYELFKKYLFEKHKITRFGFSVFFHTFGRDIKFYPHLHIIITEGGFDDNRIWKNVTYFHWAFFQNSWKKIISDVLKNNLPESNSLKNALNRLWEKNSNIYFNLKGQTIKNSISAVKYLTRYLARPPIAEHRITHLDNNSVSFWYKDVKSKDSKNVSLTLFQFIGKLLIQIPPKNFKMVRHYGIYARHIDEDFRFFLSFLVSRKNKTQRKKSWEQKIFEWLGINPLLCPKCNTKE